MLVERPMLILHIREHSREFKHQLQTVYGLKAVRPLCLWPNSAAAAAIAACDAI